jgi:hypothetical protein
MSDQPLKLLAVDAEDLSILSAHLQDSVVKVSDFAYLPAEKRFAFAANRFDWIAAVEGEGNHRRRAAMHFDRVRSVKCRNIDRSNPAQALCLLAMSFEETDSPSGIVELAFAGGASIRIDVECIEAKLADLGPVWACNCCPEHAVEEVETA